jgi:hypothetical protein
MINKTNTECETTLCYYETATRPRFFHGMLLTDEHLRAEQDYHREALKRVNRHLWGSGIVCGLTVEIKDLCVKINPGVAIDCCGNLIEVCKCITLDLSKECEKEFGSDCPPRQPPPAGNDYGIKKYLVLRYMERETDPEPVLTPDTDCEPAGGKSKCSASKVQEGFCIELWDKCPCPRKDQDERDLLTILREAGEHKEMAAAYRVQPPLNPPRDDMPKNQGPMPPPEAKDCIDLPLPCEDCGCCESAVGLAVLTINCEKKTVERKTECDCRRYVISPRLLNWLFSRLRPKDMSHELGEVHSSLGDHPTANLMAAGVNHLAYKDELTELEKLVTDPNKPVKPTPPRTAALRTRLSSKKRTPPTPKPSVT